MRVRMLEPILRSFPRWGLAMLLCGGLVACSPDAKDSGAVPGDDLTAVSKSTQVNLSPRERLLSFGQEWAYAMSSMDDEVARGAWNVEGMLDRALGPAGTQFPTEAATLRAEYKEGEKQHKGGVMFQAFGAPWAVLGYHEVEGQPRLMCRAIVGGGLTYVDLIPELDAVGQPRLVDAYMFSSGELLSETLQRALLPQLAISANQPLEAVMSDMPKPMVLHFNTVAGFLQSAAGRDYGAAIQRFGALPESLQREKFVLIQYLGAIIFLMDEHGQNSQLQRLFHDGMLNFEVMYGDDPAYLLIGMEYALFKEDYVGALEIINRLDATVGGDPYLDSLRSDVMAILGQFDEARRLAIQARDAVPNVEDTYWRVLDLQLRLGDWTGAAAELDQLVEQFSYRFDIANEPYYQAFCQTDVGKAWLVKHQQEFGS